LSASRGEVFLKIETLQPTFSYKIRGAFNAVLKLVEEGRDVPALVTASAGNHGRALAHAAAAVGLPLTVYVPEQAPRTKIDAIRRAGAQLRTCAGYDEAERRAKEHGAGGTALFVSPYSHPDVIAGAGTIGLEILEEDPAVDAVIVPVGGGGLISGIAIAVKESSRRAIDVIGVETAASTPFTRGLAAGRIVEIDVRPTLADGLAGNLDPETVTFDVVRRLVSHIATVTEDQLRDAVRGLAVEEKLVTEGAGAAGVAAVLAGLVNVQAKRAAVVVSGGNIDADKLKGIL
jgi:threonine dehydratase